MKKLTLLSLSFLTVLTLSVLVFYTTSCTKDPCKDVVCQNSGTSVADGDVCNCNCTTGYEGTNCETESRIKFDGLWAVVDNGSGSGESDYNITVTNGATVVDINIAGLYQTITNSVKATISGTSITIPSQDPDSNNHSVSGQGSISADGKTVNLQYTILNTLTNQSDVVSSKWTK